MLGPVPEDRRRGRGEYVFHVAGPIAHTAQQAIESLLCPKGMNAVLMFAEEGAVFAAWHRDTAGAP
jgi:hypothetical protein